MSIWGKLSAVSAIAALMSVSAFANYQIDTSANWKLSLSGTVSLGNYFNQSFSVSNIPVTINQLSNPMDVDNDDEDDFQLVINLGGIFPTGYLEFGLFNDGSGDYVRGDSENPGPFTIPAGTTLSFPGLGSITVPVDVRISNVTVNAVGNIVTQTFSGVNYITQVNGVGGNVGDPNASWVTADVEAYIDNQWQSIGQAQLAIDSWQLVPEPASMLALGAGLASLMGLRRRKR